MPSDESGRARPAKEPTLAPVRASPPAILAATEYDDVDEDDDRGAVAAFVSTALRIIIEPFFRAPPGRELSRESLSVWFMSSGNAGSRNQARGLASALSPDAVEKVVRVGWPWSWVPAALFPLTGVRLSDGRPLRGPWPRVLVSCGRRAGLAALAVRAASRGQTIIVHIERPPGRAAAFDAVIAMPHDRVSGANVLCVDTALHAVVPAAVTAAVEHCRDDISRLPRPMTGVLLGGSAGGRAFEASDLRRLLADLERRRAAEGGSLLITPSRRTPATLIDIVRDRYAGDPNVFLWDGAAPNPYLEILGMADRLVVTSDSISMVSEALATQAPVSIFEVPGGKRHRRFVEGLLEQKLVGRSSDAGDVHRHAAVDSMATAAAFVRDRLRRRGLDC